uniref:Alpha-macroglobulin-like TED domain-containing protein n=1 Tax=Pelusios castaneus TaxID=367368 RepID=A0A8C8RYZ9_9SAUR
ANVLVGSERAHVTVLGDITGTALQNIDRLLAMPYGCGEQNIGGFATNVYIQQYLEKSGQLTPEIRDKAQEFLQSGECPSLLYKRDNGSYSAYGKNDTTGNTWLTAFVLKSFGQARPYIFIDEKHIEDALGWLQRHQLESGCFQSVGSLLDVTLQGGVKGELSLSAYITVVLLELGLPLTDPMVNRALHCLREASNTSDLYMQALLAYVFGLAGNVEQQSALLQSLAQHREELHWQKEVKYRNQAPWVEVEMTAYVLLAYLSVPSISAADMVTASQIVHWLSKQQKPYGGFHSTQDTVVALQALAKYAALTYSTNESMLVTVSSQAGARQEFHVDNTNQLMLQRVALQEIPGQYTVQASGKGCVFVQTSAGPRRREASPPHHLPWSLFREIPHHNSCCRYSGERPATNMAVIKAKLPSGYIPDKGSLRQVSFPGRRTGWASQTAGNQEPDPLGESPEPRKTPIAALSPPPTAGAHTEPHPCSKGPPRAEAGHRAALCPPANGRAGWDPT